MDLILILCNKGKCDMSKLILDLNKSTKYKNSKEPMIVATNGKYVVVRRGKIHYAVVEEGKPLRNVEWHSKKFLYSLLTKARYKTVNPPKLYKEQLNKAILYKDRLVQKQVPVRGENGKVFYRRQWVKATEEDSNPRESHIKPLDNNSTSISKNKVDQKSLRIDINDYDIPQSLRDCTSKLDKLIKNLPETISSQNLQDISTVVSDSYDKLSDLIQSDIASSEATPLAKNIQKSTLRMIKKQSLQDVPFVSLGTNPSILKYMLDSFLGKDLANSLRKQLNSSNLTINTYLKDIENIKKDGYRCYTIENYVDSSARDEDNKEIHDLLTESYDYTNTEEAIEFLEDSADNLSFAGSDIINEIATRARAEYKAMGLYLEDPKPCYIAYNPGNSEEGGAPSYGDGGVLEISPNLLKDCTLNIEDTFDRTEPIPKIYGMEHLKDLMILKSALHSGKDIKASFQDVSSDWITKSKGDIPLEIQYHRESISPEYIKILKG